MNQRKWEEKARILADEHAARSADADVALNISLGLASPTVEQLRRALIEIDHLLRDAPTPIQQRYKNISETDLRNLTDDAQAFLDAGSLAWLDRDLVEAAAAQVRALDCHLFHHSHVRGKPSDPSKDFLCSDSNVHAIPRPHVQVPEAGSIGTKTYRRRGIFWHRLIPREVSGYTIDLHWYRDLSLSFRRPEAKVLGALFDKLSLVRDADYGGFVAQDAPCMDEDDTIRLQVEAANAGGVTVALWPELTMPPTRRNKLAQALLEASSDTPPGQGAGIIAAGSWHEVSDGKVCNRLHVISGLGEPRFCHDKSLPLESTVLGSEELDPSYRISVLINDDALIAFAICRDFCEAQVSEVYLELDVDLVVVPSYGDTKTIEAHYQQAKNLSVNPGTRVFVVQQVVANEVDATGTGYILPPMAVDEGALYAVEMATSLRVSTFPISFKRV